ncbi:MAG: hypothetical protein R3E10_14340 [Gemmatimonadota bacterium]
MITAIRSAEIHDGQVDKAFEWGVKVARYIDANIEGVSVEVLRSIGGSVFQIHWMSRYQSLAAFEQVWSRLETDSGYRTLIAEARDQGLLIGASIEDNLFQSVG